VPVPKPHFPAPIPKPYFPAPVPKPNFPVPVPKPYFPARSQNRIARPRGPSKQVWDVFKCIWGVFVASNLHVARVRTIVQSIESKHFWIFNSSEQSFASPSGRTHFREPAPKTKKETKYKEAFKHTAGNAICAKNRNYKMRRRQKLQYGQKQKIHSEANAENTSDPHDESPHVVRGGRRPPGIIWPDSIFSICLRMYFLLLNHIVFSAFGPSCISGPAGAKNQSFFGFPVL